MANSDRLAEVVALIAERDQDFQPIEMAATGVDEDTGEPYWPMSKLMGVLGVDKPRKIERALNKAKIAASKAELKISDHFTDGDLFKDDGEVYLSKYAAYLVVMNSDPDDGEIGKAQVYFALQVDRQQLEDEKRLRTRLDICSEQRKLTGVAQDSGVRDFCKFNGMGIQGLYGGRTVTELKDMKGIPAKANHLDFAGSEELAANLFRITQTRAALARQGCRSETVACKMHKAVGKRIRDTIIESGNTPPEELPAAQLKIDKLATAAKRKIAN